MNDTGLAFLQALFLKKQIKKMTTKTHYNTY